MITEEEIIEIIKEENPEDYKTLGEYYYGIAKAIVDKIKERESCDGCGRIFFQYDEGKKFCARCMGELEDEIYDLKKAVIK